MRAYIERPHRSRIVHRPFYRRFFPHFLRQVAEDRFVVLNVDGQPVGLAQPAERAATACDVAAPIQLQLDESVLLELEALGARIAMEGIYLFDKDVDPTASGIGFSDYANRLHAIASLAVTH
ncbi:hypothetical protein P3W24_06450 [Luteibacter sp. PPL201]|uniref:PilZ domain-containing protein n=1 Tax=Luteibacter sahnii TaxID=3021977 RepID=A0ABT6BBG5_9GAMM|nr:hypothetical protein [Luteibacter sp. PPL193]MDY1549513.1 hypothetical protein [Luteibacter sp. PPL193]